MRKWVWLPLAFWAGELRADYMTVDCLGKRDARRSIVYLHGWDAPSLSAHEKRNRVMWEKMATDLDLRIALPRGDGRCNKGMKQCWRVRSRSDVKHSWQRILQGAEKCSLKKPYGVVGFSNGGYLVSGLYHNCLANKETAFLLATGSAGLSSNPPIGKKSCGRFILQIGRKDITKGRAEQYMATLKRAKSPAEFKLFPGGHILHRPSIEAVIRNYLP